MCSQINVSDVQNEPTPPEGGIGRLDAATYESLFEHMFNGVAYCQMLFDGEEAQDFIYRYTNPAFHAQTGLGEVIGKRVSEVVPGIRESDGGLFEIYGRVARQGQPEKFEAYVEALGEWFAISVYSPQPDHFVAIFDVITEQKRVAETLRKTEEHYRQIVETTNEGIWVLDAAYQATFVNPALCRIFGYGPEEMLGHGVEEFILEPDLADHRRQVKYRHEGKDGSYERRFRRKDGSVCWCAVTSTAVRDPDGAFTGAFAMLTDITERKQAEVGLTNALAQAQRFQEALDQVSAYIYMKDRQHRYVYANRSTLALFACTAEELAGRDDTHFFPPTTVERLREVDARVFAGECTREEIDVADAPGGRRVYWEVKAPIYADPQQTEIWGLVGVSTDITERMELERQLKHQAHTDFLTGIANRGYFLELASLELARVRRYRGQMSIAMLDLDHFKVINDTYGHEVGDRVLKQFTHLCRSTLRELDVMGRLGGEEFAVLFPETSASQALDVAERVRQAIASAEIALERGLPIQITVSLGMASFIESDANIDILLNRADQALYEAKRSGRNRICEAIVSG